MDFLFVAEAATFVARPNRFRVVAELHATGATIHAHCADPGRLRELLIPGVTVFVSRADNPNRKTAYDLRFVRHPEHGQLVSLDSRVPNALVAHELARGTFPQFAGYIAATREVPAPHRSGTGVHSRFDFRLTYPGDRLCWIEVKSATLVEDGVARFPDAPTVRGRRHVDELATLVRDGDRAAILFIIQRPDARQLEPNWPTDPAFGAALQAARAAGVALYAYTCDLTPTAIAVRHQVPVALGTR